MYRYIYKTVNIYEMRPQVTINCFYNSRFKSFKDKSDATFTVSSGNDQKMVECQESYIRSQGKRQDGPEM